MENFDDRAQRVQDRLREAGDEEAAELIDELYAIAFPEGESAPVPKARWQDDPRQYTWSGGTKVRKTGAMVTSLARAKGHAARG